MNASDFDSNTGELLDSRSSPWYDQPGKIESARKVSDVTVKRPIIVNLKDHPEMDGKKIAIVKVIFSPGEFGEYTKLCAWTIKDDKPDQAIVVMTGSEDVLAKAYAIEEAVSQGDVFVGTLRNVGKQKRTWILE